MIQGAMQDDTVAEGREHLILIAVWSPVLQRDRSAFLPSCPQSCCSCAVHNCAVFNFVPIRWQRFRIL